MKRHFQYPSSLLYRYKNSLVITILGLFLAGPVSAQLTFTNPEADIADQGCKACHPRQFNEWQGSMMAYAAVSPTFNALEHIGNHSVLNDNNENGLFAAGGGDNRELFCQGCHTPTAVALDAIAGTGAKLLPPFTGSNKRPTVDILRDIANGNSSLKDAAATALHGVSCDSCHQTIGEEHTQNAFFYAGDNGIANASFLYTSDLFTKFGPFADAAEDGHLTCQASPYGTSSPDCVTNESDHEKGGYISSPQFCGSCHDVRPESVSSSPSHAGEDQEEFLRLENLYTEWSESQWAADNVSCQDCHMSTYPYGAEPGTIAKPGLYPVDYVSTNESQPRRQVSSHYFTGVDVSLDSSFNSVQSAAPIDGDPDNLGPTYNSQDTLAKQKVRSMRYLNQPNLVPNDYSTQLIYMPIGQRQRREDLLKSAVDLQVQYNAVSLENSGFILFEVTLENIGAGHNVPSGFSQERQFWIDIELTDANGKIVFESGYLKDSDDDGLVNDEPLNNFVHLEEDIYDLSISQDTLNEFGLGGKTWDTLTNVDFYNLLGDDTQLKSFGNKFRRQGPDGNGKKYTNEVGTVVGNGIEVFSPFLADEMDNSHSLEPHKPETFTYLKFNVDSNSITYPLKAKVSLKFRAFPPNFLDGLEHSMEDAYNQPNLLPHNLADLNKIIVMASKELTITKSDSSDYFAFVSATGRCFQRSSSIPGSVHLKSCSNSAVQEVQLHSNGNIKFSNGGCLTVPRNEYDQITTSNLPSITVGVEQCVTGSANKDHQTWTATADGQLKIRKLLGSQWEEWCVQRSSFDGTAGTLILNHCGEIKTLGQGYDYTQQFFYEPNFRPIVSGSRKCLDVDSANIYNDGAKVQVWTCNGTPGQQWMLSKTGLLINAAGLCLDIDSSVGVNRTVQGWHCSETNYPWALSSNQRWKFEGGSLVSAFSSSGESFCLGTVGGSSANGAEVTTVECDSYQTQDFGKTSSYKISSLHWQMGTIDNINLEGNWAPSGGRNHSSPNNVRYKLNIEQGQEVQIDLTSNIDNYLYLVNGSGSIIQQNDDGGPSLNARINRTLSVGSYFVVAATYSSGQTGDFDLSVKGSANLTLRKVNP